MKDILEKLKGGDRRSIGRVEEVVQDVFSDPSLFHVLFKGLSIDDPVIRMRSADAVEKITAKHPDYLQPYKTELMGQLATIKQQEVRWHVAQMLPRLRTTKGERAVIAEILFGYLNDKSNIVRTFAMQALADLAETEPLLLSKVIPLLEKLTRTGSPAVKTRGKKLLEKLDRTLKPSPERDATDKPKARKK